MRGRDGGRRCRASKLGRTGTSRVGDESGFTLVEVLVAATLLIVSVLATLALLDQANRSTAVSKQRDVANALAQEMVERATGGRYTATRNDLTDVHPGAPEPGPADRMRAALDPDDDQEPTAVTPATITAGPLPVNLPQSWSLRRKNTVYTVSYRACTRSDAYQGLEIAGPFDCLRATGTNPGGDNEVTVDTCSLGVVPPAEVDPDDPGQLTAKVQLLGVVGISVCLGAVSEPLSDALCTLLGQSPLLDSIKQSLLGSNGTLSTLLGGLAGSSVGLCESSLSEQGLAGAQDGIGTSTHLAVTVSWTGLDGRARSIDQSSLIRRAATA